MLVGLEDVTEVGTVENVFKRREDTDPDSWSIFAWNEPFNVMSVNILAIRVGGCASLDISRESWHFF